MCADVWSKNVPGCRKSAKPLEKAACLACEAALGANDSTTERMSRRAVGDALRGEGRQRITEGRMCHTVDFGFCSEMKSLGSFE